MIKELTILSNNLEPKKLEGFSYDENLGWIFLWYENEEKRAMDCANYGIVETEFLCLEFDNINLLRHFLAAQPTDTYADIRASKLIEVINYKTK